MEKDGLDALKGEAVLSEPITIEETIEMNADLTRCIEKAKIDSIKKIIKNLGTKQITMTHLVKSGIGKSLSKIADKTEDGFDDKELTEAAKNLIEIWKRKARAEKEKKAKEEEKKVNKEVRAKAEMETIRKVGYPYLPEETLNRLKGLKASDGTDYSRITITLIEDI